MYDSAQLCKMSVAVDTFKNLAERSKDHSLILIAEMASAYVDIMLTSSSHKTCNDAPITAIESPTL